MKISKNQLINGTPIKKIRDFLRKYSIFRIDTLVQENICGSIADANSIIDRLKTEGFIEPHEYTETQSWITTIRGNAFRKAKFIKPLDRVQAVKLLNTFLERVNEG